MAAKDIDKVFKALADPSRRQLIDSLHAKNGQTLSELCEGLDMARQSVTQHLDFLEAANLISVQWQGREKLHNFNPVPIHEIYERWLERADRADGADGARNPVCRRNRYRIFAGPRTRLGRGASRGRAGHHRLLAGGYACVRHSEREADRHRRVSPPA